MSARINYTITSPPSRKMFLHFGKLKKMRRGVLCGGERSDPKVETSYLERLGPGWVLKKKVSRRGNAEPCDYTAFRSALSL